MRIFVFYITQFSGHYKVACSIAEYLKSIKDVKVRELDLFKYLFPFTERIINFLYTLTIRKFPFIWQGVYDKEFVVKNLGRLEKVIFKLAFKKLNKLFSEYRPCCVICTQAFPCILTSYYKEKTSSNFLIFAILTDFLPHRFWLNKNIDFYVTSTLEAKKRLLKEGVNPQKILEFGIPIRKEFFEVFEEEKILKEFNLPKNKPKILLMGGGQGIGPIANLVREFLRQNIKAHLIVVCGRNKKLYLKVKKIISNSNENSVSVFGYLEEIYKLMEVSKILISKPGGATLTEALVKELSIIILNPLPGQENNNLKIISKYNLAFKAKDTQDAFRIAKEIIENKKDLEELKFRIRDFKKNWSPQKLANFITEKCSTISTL